jgi:tetratricopeptide (TPR) repeat protein
MNSTIVRSCDRIIGAGLGLLALLVPVAVWFPSYTMLHIKTTLLQCGAAVVFAAWAVRALELGRAGMPRPLGRFVAPALAFALSALVSVLFITPSRDTSIEDLGVRIPCFLLFFVTALSFSDFNRVRYLYAALMTSGFVVSVYGMVQHFGLDPFAIGDSARIQSTFGNPNFYVGYLTLMVPAAASGLDLADPAGRRKVAPVLVLALALGLAYYVCYLLAAPLALRAALFPVFLAALAAVCAARRLGAQSAALIAFYLLVNNLLLTGSRSALIGLGSGLIIFLALSFAFVFRAVSLRKILLVSTAALLVAGLAAGGVLYITRSDQGRQNVVSERKYYVQGALELFTQKPVFGHGIGTFKINYPIVKSTASWAYNATCFEFVSNVYNEHLEILHDEGAVGALLWLWLLAAFIILPVAALRALAGRRRPPPAAGGPLLLRLFSPSPQAALVLLLAGCGAILAGNIFSLSMRYAATGFMFWLFLGLIAAISSAAIASPAPENGGNAAPKAISAPLRKPGPAVRLAQALLVVLAVPAIFFSCRIFLADVYLNEAIAYSRDAYAPVDTSGRVFHDIFIEGTRYRSHPELWEKAVYYYRKALSYNPYYLRARYFFGNAFNRRWNMRPQCNPAWGDAPGATRTDADRAIEQYNRLTSQAPHTFEVDYELGDLYGKLGDLDKSIACYNDYKKYKPFFTKIHHALAEAYLAKRDWANAAEALKDALDLNQQFTQGYLQLSAVYHKLGKEDLAAEMLAKAREISPAKADESMADVWLSLGEPDLAIASCRTAIARDSADTSAFFSLGWLYVQKKEWRNAIAAYEKLVALDSKHTLGFINLSNLYYETGRMDEAKAAYRKAYALDPALVESYVRGQTNKDGR